MKTVIFILLILSAKFSFSQCFFSLDGMETPGGETILLYHLGYPAYRAYAPVYKYDVSTGFGKEIMDAFFVNGSNTRSVQDYEFFPNDTSNFINCGFGMMPDNYGFVAYNDSSVFGFQEMFMYVDISQQNPSRTYAGGEGMLYRSFDGGLTYPEDSVLDFHMISVSDFNDNEIFGIDDQSHLIKSFDGGHTSIIVDDLPVHEDLYFHPNLYYDPDQQHIYRINRIFDQYYLYASDDNGNSYTWEEKFPSESPLYFSLNQSQSGEVFLSRTRFIYKSTNFGSSFNLFAELPHRIHGIYKKPSSDILYAATKYNLYEITPDTTVTIRHLSFPESLYEWFPLTVGNKWVYDYNVVDENGWVIYHYITQRTITEDSVNINGKNYFLMLYTSPYSADSLYYRIDSTSGKVYTIKYGNEGVFYDFVSEVGDSIIFDPSNPYTAGYIVYNETDFTEFGFNTQLRGLMSTSFEPSLGLVDSIGLYNSSFNEFGGFNETLKGFVKRGIVYGDTTVTGIEEDNKPVSSFSLSQNYPNPFNPSTTLSFVIGSASGGSFVTLKVYDVLGKEVATLVNEEKPSGTYSIRFDGSDLSSGVYLYQLRAGNFTATKKLIFLK